MGRLVSLASEGRKQPENEAALLICKKILCNKKLVSRGSRVDAEMRLPSSLAKARPSGFQGPKVSMATGTK